MVLLFILFSTHTDSFLHVWTPCTWNHFQTLAPCVNWLIGDWTNFPGTVQSPSVKEAYADNKAQLSIIKQKKKPKYIKHRGDQCYGWSKKTQQISHQIWGQGTTAWSSNLQRHLLCSYVIRMILKLSGAFGVTRHQEVQWSVRFCLLFFHNGLAFLAFHHSTTEVHLSCSKLTESKLQCESWACNFE